MKKILIIGATSAIAEKTARIWAQRGAQLFLVARNRERLELIASDLRVRGSPYVSVYEMDVNDFANHRPMLECAENTLGAINIVLIAHGTLSNQLECQRSVDQTLLEIKTNALSIIALLTEIANRIEKHDRGTIAVISSVAGDRGRQSNYVYGSAKAMVTVFMSGLRQRLYKSGVTVLTIKPGFVDTPMTKNFKKGVLWVSPDYIAGTICQAIDKGKDVIYTPPFWLVIMTAIKLLPEKVFKRMSL